jgi:hypothetical protein
MSILRCAKHDRIFDTYTDHRNPGQEGHPVNGHPDCPGCLAEADTSEKLHHVNAAQSAQDAANLEAQKWAAKNAEADALIAQLKALTGSGAPRTVVA